MTVHTVPALSDNYIWLITDDERHCAIVDPGDANVVLDALERLNLTPVAILLTHHHWDHSDGIPTLVERFNIPVHGPANEAKPLVTHPHRQGDEFDIPNVGHFTVRRQWPAIRGLCSPDASLAREDCRAPRRHPDFLRA